MPWSCNHDTIKWKHYRVAGHFGGEFTGHRWIPRQRPATRSFDIFFCAWIYGWANNREAGDLRRNRAHYDVIVMNCTECRVHNNNLDCITSHKLSYPHISSTIEVPEFAFMFIPELMARWLNITKQWVRYLSISTIIYCLSDISAHISCSIFASSA